MVSLSPLQWIIWRAVNDNLGANPVETLSQLTGLWTLRFLLITLALSPIRILFKRPEVVKYRRMLGLFTFFYSSIHFMVFIGLDHGFSWSYIKEDIYTSPIVDFGLLTYFLLIPLAFTSTNSMMRLLGKNWKKLHGAVYVAALLGILHFALSEKADLSDPLFYAVILLALLVIRGISRNGRKIPRSQRTGPSIG